MDAKPWTLVAPDWAALDTIRRSPQPFVLWPVCEKPLLAWWLDEAVRQQATSVRIVAVDRPHLLRRWLDARDLWSRTIEVVSHPGDGETEATFSMHHLPGEADPAPVDSPAALLRLWFDLQEQALRRRSRDVVHLDHESEPGVWFGPGVRVDPTARFFPPCWVGNLARIGPGCRVGPSAYVAPGSFLDGDVEVRRAIVCADTYVGSHTTLDGVAVQGGLLVDLERAIAVEVVDDFVLSSLAKSGGPGWFERLVARVMGGPLRLGARWLARGAAPTQTIFRLGRSREVVLETYPRGPLAIRRAAWLAQVAAGNLRLTGVLPRREEDWNALPPEARAVLENVPAGVFALSDLYDCHSAKQPDEWMHAVFQAAAPDAAGQKLAARSLLRLATMRPISS